MASTNETVGINRTYKDRLFRLRFGSEEYKEDMVSLYNSLNRTEYSNMVLWEQQSSINGVCISTAFIVYSPCGNSRVQLTRICRQEITARKNMG